MSFSTLFLSLILYTSMPADGLADEILWRQSIIATEDNDEFRVRLDARVPESSWREDQAGTLLKIFVDDRYDQHLILVGGDQDFPYDFLIGPLDQGTHTLRIEWDNSWTPALKRPPQVGPVEVRTIDRKDPNQGPALRAPILYIRKDTLRRFSDVPLLMYWDYEDRPAQPKWIVYTVIFSNEDGGTDTERLMARWGRTTDIEWCYAYYRNAERLQQEYQGPDHKTLPFRGKNVGRHPVLYTQTLNNNFSDSPEDSPEFRVRPFPTFADLKGRARETVMDRYPWTYRVMAEEMIREKKIEEASDAASLKVSDLRNYAYIEVCARQRGTELYFELQLKGGGPWYSSNHGDPKGRIARSGCFQSTIELPEGTRQEELRSLRVQCLREPTRKGEKPIANPQASLESVPKLFLLKSDYEPAKNLLSLSLQKALKPGQALVVHIE